MKDRGQGSGVRGHRPLGSAIIGRALRLVRVRGTARASDIGHRTSRILLISLLALNITACEWFSDFKRQPDVVTWEPWRGDSLFVRGSPQGSVPTTGTFMPAYMVSYSPLPGTIDSLAAIPNPTPISQASLENGRKYFTINCLPCHGERGMGDGPTVKYGMVPMTLMSDLTKNRSDGYIYGMIRNGRGLMPTYNRIEEMDRWDIVNYIRALQGRVTTVPFGVGPLAAPGVTGDKVPGATRFGPTMPVPHVGQRGAAPGAAPNADSTRRGADSTRRGGTGGGR